MKMLWKRSKGPEPVAAPVEAEVSDVLGVAVEVPAAEAEYTPEAIAAFQDEIKKPMVDNKKLFYLALLKEPAELTPDEIRALIFRMSYLGDAERYKYRDIIVLENLTPEEESRFRKLYNKQLFEKYFPHRGAVEEHYKLNFLAGR